MLTDGRTDGRQAHRYIPRTFRSGDKNATLFEWKIRGLLFIVLDTVGLRILQKRLRIQLNIVLNNYQFKSGYM